MNVDHLSKLPTDLFIKEITYLPFRDVISICSANKTLHDKCMSDDNGRWKSLIYSTFGDVYDFPTKLKQIQDKLNTTEYNYLIYTQLINILDSVTQLMIYHKQKDMESFNSKKFGNDKRTAALFLLNERAALEKYFSNSRDIWRNILDNKYTKQDINHGLIDMAAYGNMKGVIMMLEKGADINVYGGSPLFVAHANKHFDVVKYLEEQGAR